MHCIVTSPPYYGLRDYSTGRWEGGDPTCDHKDQLDSQLNAGVSSAIPHTGAATKRARQVGEHKVCVKCGAVRIDQQMGLEDTPQEYVTKMVELFHEYRRVLRDDGTLWLNMGDSYSGASNSGGSSRRVDGGLPYKLNGLPKKNSGLQPKNLMGMPWRIAFGLQDDGWILRSDIIWAKPNAMPESVTDRPTTSHEHIFLLTKSPKYFYDQEAVRETSVSDHPSGNGYKRDARLSYQNADGTARGNDEQWKIQPNRNLRSVWTIATEPTPFAHFATFPQKLVERCLMAGCPHKTCAVCGAPWERLVERDEYPDGEGHFGKNGSKWKGEDKQSSGYRPRKNVEVMRQVSGNHDNPFPQKSTVGWIPTCDCSPGIATEPGLALDPFMGSGTVALVARRSGRDYIGCDLNPEYVRMANGRLDVPYTLPMMEVLQA